ncbi:MAG: amidohydrolase family protein [Candidatus Poribacteria bacterium]
MIDINTFIGHCPFRRLPATTPDELWDLLKVYGIERALVSPIEGIFYEEPQIANEMLASQLDDRDELLQVAVLNPTLANWERSLRQCYEKYHIAAVKLHPNYHTYRLEDSPARDLLSAVGDMRLPVIVQLRVNDTRSHHPLMQVPDVPVADVIAAAGKTQQVKIVLGGIKWGEAQGNAAKITALPNLWLDISQMETMDGLRRLIDACGTERLLFGTHAPFFYIRSAIIKLDEAQLSDEERERITRRNSERIFSS